jgi:hypothetical protein
MKIKSRFEIHFPAKQSSPAYQTNFMVQPVHSSAKYLLNPGRPTALYFFKQNNTVMSAKAKIIAHSHFQFFPACVP